MSIAQDDAQSNGRPLLEVGRHRILAEAQAVAAMVNAMDDHFLAALHLIESHQAKYWSVEWNLGSSGPSDGTSVGGDRDSRRYLISANPFMVRWEL